MLAVLLGSILISVSKGVENVCEIKVDPAKTYQVVEGLGASLTDSSAWLIYKFLTPAERKAVLDELFGKSSGIGLSYLRQPMGGSDFRLKEYSYDDLPEGVAEDRELKYFSIGYDKQYIIPVLQEILAVNPDLKIMGSPWSPPLWMKSGGELGKGYLRHEAYESYAEYFSRYILAYGKEGLEVSAVTLQNEPYFEPGSYGGCFMSPSDQIKLVKKLGQSFESHGIKTDILIWDHNWDRPEYPIEVLSDAEANKFIAGTAFHHYGGNIKAQTEVHNKFPDKGIYFTEGSDGTWNDRGFERNLLANGRFVIDAVNNWSKSIIKWNLALDEKNGPKIAGGCDTCYGVITIDQRSRKVTRNAQFYAMGHLSRFIEPGAVRIAVDGGDIACCGLKNADGSIVVYVVNDKEQDRELKLELGSRKSGVAVKARSISTICIDGGESGAVMEYYTTAKGSNLLPADEADFAGSRGK